MEVMKERFPHGGAYDICISPSSVGLSEACPLGIYAFKEGFMRSWGMTWEIFR